MVNGKLLQLSQLCTVFEWVCVALAAIVAHDEVLELLDCFWVLVGVNLHHTK
jgi:hypothetical protein